MRKKVKYLLRACSVAGVAVGFLVNIPVILLVMGLVLILNEML